MDWDAQVKQTADGLGEEARELLLDLYEQEEIDMDALYEPAADELVIAGLAHVTRPARSIDTYLVFERSRYAIDVTKLVSPEVRDGE